MFVLQDISLEAFQTVLPLSAGKKKVHGLPGLGQSAKNGRHAMSVQSKLDWRMLP